MIIGNFEPEIKERIIINNTLYECVKNSKEEICINCDLYGKTECYSVICGEDERKDNNSVIFREIKNDTYFKEFEKLLQTTFINEKDKGILRTFVKNLLNIK